MTALIPRNSLAWLLIAQLVVLVPHLPRLPWWIAVLWLGCALWRVQIQRMRWGYPGRLLRAGGLLLTGLAVYLSQGTLIGLDATVMLLLLLFMLKLLEMRSPRDALVVIYLGFFIVATAFLFDQGIPLALYQGFCALILVAALVGLQQSPARNDPAAALRRAGAMVLQALPLMLVLFLFFPRLAPLWSVNVPGSSARTGLSESMAPADIANLAQSPELAFRVEFDGQVPPASTLYWRALTLSRFDGRTWSYDQRLEQRTVPPLSTAGAALVYQVVAEPSGRNWLYSLSGSVSSTPQVNRLADDTLRALRPLSGTFAYTATAHSDALLQPEGLSVSERRRELQLPPSGDPRARAWARQLRAEYGSDAQLIQAVLAHFSEQPFYYTLQPSPLGQHANDEFLFDSRRGFCEHYAGAMAFVLRAAGIPARIVTGYQGGELNPRGGYLLVHQFDAHAWVEAWLPGTGWTAFDPTFQVAPTRIERGLEEAMREEGSFLADAPLSGARYRGVSWLNSLRLSWDDLNYQWQRRVLNFRSEEQLALFRRWLGTADWQRIGVIVLALVFTLMAVQAFFWLRPARRTGTPAQRAWQQLDRRLRPLGLGAQAGEGPRDWQQRIGCALPSQTDLLAAFFDCFVAQQYAGGNADAALLRAHLKRLLRNLPRRRSAGLPVKRRLL
jgi:transglutaminase-like putative cysteine protease